MIWLTPSTEDVTGSGFYCRLSVRSKVDEKPACITPLGSNLLRYNERWKIPLYTATSNSVVIDFTPSVLGIAEGFSQEGFEIGAVIDFDPKLDMTWKVSFRSKFTILRLTSW